MSHIYTDKEKSDWQKTLPTKRISASLLLRHDSKVIMVKAAYKDHWTFPGGVIEKDESPIQAAVRETFEEIGVRVESDELRFAQAIYTSSHHEFPDRLHLFYIADVDFQETTFQLQSTEIEKAAWVLVSDVSRRAGVKRGTYRILQRWLVANKDDPGYSEVFIS